MKSGFVITIDGPAASGKSSVSRQIAQRFNFPWVSTGAFYRGLAYSALKLGIELENVDELVRLCNSDEWKIKLTPEKTVVLFHGDDVTESIAHEDVGTFASRISLHPPIRASLLAGQRSCALNVPGLVAEGRDCGSVVFPDADVKIYLTADQEKRAQRRALEHGAETTEILKAQKVRDAQDTQRKVAPLLVPADSLVIDTTDLSLSEVVDVIAKHVEEKIKK